MYIHITYANDVEAEEHRKVGCKDERSSLANKNIGSGTKLEQRYM